MTNYSAPSTAYAPTHGGYPGSTPAGVVTTDGATRSTCCGETVSRATPGVGPWSCDNCAGEVSI